MNEALRVYSWRGILVDSIEATAIKSRADARKLGPFADSERRRVTWVRWTQVAKTNRWRRAHFRHFPKTHPEEDVQADLRREFERREVAKAESSEHLGAKEHLAAYLQGLVAARRSLRWAFVDKRVSGFCLTGDLLSDVAEVRTEYPIHTPFGRDYKLDIALLGPRIARKHIVLGGIEIEFAHEFEMTRCLVCKALGFPLLSIDIAEFAEWPMSSFQWLESALVETTVSSDDQRRRNYIYIHDALYPVYMDIPTTIAKENRHQYIVFAKEEQFDRLLSLLLKLKEVFGISGNAVLIQPVPCKNEQMRAMFLNEGSIAGHDWSAYNGSKYIRVTLDKPVGKAGPIYKYHLAMASLLNAHFHTLVGYKFRPGIYNEDPADPIWQVWIPDDGIAKKTPLIQKHLSEPLSSNMAVLESLR
jgi:hypothetical protein